MAEVWRGWYECGQITEDEYNQYIESCKHPRQVYSVEDMPQELIDAIAKAEMPAEYNHLNDLLEDSEENKNDRMVQKHIDFFGLPVCVEIIRGGVKYSETYDGKPWQRTMKCDYGYFDGITGADGEYLDCYVGPDYKLPESKVYIVKQMRPDGSEFDEDKIIIGCMTDQQAKDLYMEHCHSEKCFGGIKEYTIDQFRELLSKHGHVD